MKKIFNVVVLSLTVFVPSLHAADETDTRAMFVGRYGEVIRYSEGSDVDAYMAGNTEVVNFYSTMYLAPDGVVRDRNPPITRSDFRPENFTRLRLIQLMVYPRATSTFSSLEDLRKKKIEELEKSGAEFRTIKSPGPSVPYSWPQGSFEIIFEKPYPYRQLYTQDDGLIFILTAGRDVRGVGQLGIIYEYVRDSVRDHVMPEEKREALTKNNLLQVVLSSEPVLFYLLFPFSILLAGSFLPTSRLSGIRAFFRSALMNAAFGSVWLALLTFLGVVVPALAARPFHILGGVLLFPAWMCLTQRRGVWRHVIIFVWCGVLSLYFHDVFKINYRLEMGWVIAVVGAIVGMKLGIVATLICAASDFIGRRRGVAAALLLLVLPRSSWAAVASDLRIAQLRQEAESELSAVGKPAGIRKSIVEERRLAGDYYDFQRVEITGVLSADGTQSAFPGMFDLPAKPSTLSDLESSLRPNADGLLTKQQLQAIEALDGLAGVVSDATQSVRSIVGFANQAEKKIESQLKGKEINEIVAHSWGTAVLYNLIKAGRVNAPKKIIVIGMPTHEYWKWEELSKHTGTEVVLYTPPKRDWLPMLVESGRRLMLGAGGSETFLRASERRSWDEVCAKNPKNCDRFDRHGSFKTLDVPKKFGHDRFKYYRAMLPTELKKSAVAMHADQESGISASARESFEAVVIDKMKEIEKARHERKAWIEAQDKALRLSLAEIAIRGCRNPGSVTQAELDALPRPSSPRFYEGKLPSGLDADCSQSLYLSLAMAISHGGRLSASQAAPFVPVTPTAAGPVFTPRARIPPESMLVKSDSKAPFTAFFPELKILAQRACDAPASLSDTPLARLPFEHMAYATTDEQVAGGMTRDLDVCARGVFLALVRTIREGKSGEINRVWVVAQAALARPAPTVSPISSGDSGPTPEYNGGPQTLPPWATNFGWHRN